VDSAIAHLKPHLERGDILMDGGNSFFLDTERRNQQLEAEGFNYIGTGVSGGEEGALWGPAIMPGGQHEAWEAVATILRAIAARAEDDQPCVEYMGPRGAGHFVKMVHNGIEYGDMELICEAYQLMRDYLGMNPDEMHEVFAEWNKTELDSYLIEITSDILAYKDEEGNPLVNKILDAAGQKGTGKWTVNAALDEGVPLTLIAEAVFARCLSAIKEERVAASKVLSGPAVKFTGNRAEFIANIRSALYASKIISYAQGFALIRAAAKTYGWDLHYDEIALMWRGGCIIRSVFLEQISNAFKKDPSLSNLLLAPYFQKAVAEAQRGWRTVCAEAIINGISTPALTSALSYYDGYRCANLPANLLQAQRDYFGAHTYERVDMPRGQFFHTNWTGHGGSTASTTYSA
jgi:6-phosphogluconate dehydrogenase